MKKSYLLLLAMLWIQLSFSQPNFCFDYNDKSLTSTPVSPLDNWQAINGQFAYSNDGSQEGSSDLYLRAYDGSGGSWAYNNVDFAGDWSQNGGNKCLCYDFRIFEGIPGTSSTPSSLYIYNGSSPAAATSMAIFSLTTALDVSDGWRTICPSLGFADSEGNLPSNSDGQWIMTGSGTASDWNFLLQNVSGIGLRLDLPNGPPTEIYGYDNICLKPCPEKQAVYDFDPCCPPLNEESMVDLFHHVPTGSITAPYLMDFSPGTLFMEQMQAYINYLNTINPAVTHLYFTWRLMDMGDGDDPLTSYYGAGQIGSDIFSHFVPDGTTMLGNTDFFPHILEPNHWYKVHVGIYLNNDIEIFDKNCSDDTWFTFNYKIDSNRVIGFFADNEGKVLKATEVITGKKKSGKVNPRKKVERRQ